MRKCARAWHTATRRVSLRSPRHSASDSPPKGRQTMSDKDVDAQFADIVAHWDEVATPPVIKAAEDAEAEPAVAPPTDAPRPGVNPPPEMGFVVWRGTSPTPRADDAASGIEDTIDDLDDPDD